MICIVFHTSRCVADILYVRPVLLIKKESRIFFQPQKKHAIETASSSKTQPFCYTSKSIIRHQITFVPSCKTFDFFLKKSPNFLFESWLACYSSFPVEIEYFHRQVTLSIRHATSDDAGKYKCTIRSGTQEIEVTAQIIFVEGRHFKSNQLCPVSFCSCITQYYTL